MILTMAQALPSGRSDLHAITDLDSMNSGTEQVCTWHTPTRSSFGGNWKETLQSICLILRLYFEFSDFSVPQLPRHCLSPGCISTMSVGSTSIMPVGSTSIMSVGSTSIMSVGSTNILSVGSTSIMSFGSIRIDELYVEFIYNLEALRYVRNRQSSLLESSVGCLLYVLPAFPPVSLQEYTIKSISARLRIQLRPTTRGLRTRPLLHGLRVMLELRLERPTVSQQKPDICSQTWCFCEVSRNRSPVVSKPALAPTTVHRNRNGSSVCGLASGTTAA